MKDRQKGRGRNTPAIMAESQKKIRALRAMKKKKEGRTKRPELIKQKTTNHERRRNKMVSKNRILRHRKRRTTNKMERQTKLHKNKNKKTCNNQRN